MARKVLLLAGILASLLYACMNIFVPLGWEGYSSASQTVSELSAIGAPTRATWIPCGVAYALLMIAFGFGVTASADRNRRLRIAGVLLIAYAVVSLFWPLAPMHLRGAPITLTDTMHIVLAIVTVALMLAAIGFAASTLGARFRAYSIATMVLLLAFGLLTTIDAPHIAVDLPTPWIGVWERLDIGVFLLWVVVLADVLLTAPTRAAFNGAADSSARPARDDFSGELAIPTRIPDRARREYSPPR